MTGLVQAMIGSPLLVVVVVAVLASARSVFDCVAQVLL